MQNDKLLPCPFCGGEVEIKQKHDIFEDTYEAYIQCKCCMARTESVDTTCSSSDGFVNGNNLLMCLIKLWNTRKPMERIMEQFEKEREKGFYDHDSVIGEKNVWTKAIEIVKGGIDNAE